MSSTTPEVPRRAPEARLINEVRGGLDDLKRLAVMEVELAKAEALGAIKRVAVAIGILVGALLFLYAAFIYAIATVAYVLGAFDHWWGVLATAGALVLVAGLVALLAIRIAMRAKNEAQSAIRSIKGDVEWLRQLAKRPTSAS